VVRRDHHLALAELALREAGWRTAWAGRRTPAAELAVAAQNGLVDLVVLSASLIARDRRLLARVLGAVTRTGVRVAVGGAGAWPDSPTRFHDFGGFSRWLAPA
jgi:methylmalonyl-CoA mutase cobalamin-binding subunit